MNGRLFEEHNPQFDGCIAYLIEARTGLSPERATHMAATSGEVEAALLGLGFRVLVSRDRHPPGRRYGASAERLGWETRTDVSSSHAIIGLYDGDGADLTAELYHAGEHLVPLVILRRGGVRVHELVRSLPLHCLGHLSYKEPQDACEKLTAFLRDHASAISERAADLNTLRASMNGEIGRTIRQLRERVAWPRFYLAEKSRVPESWIAAIENDSVAANPPLVLLHAIARALGVDVQFLIAEPGMQLGRDYGATELLIAEQEGWSIRDLRRYWGASSLEHRVRGLSMSDLRGMMRQRKRKFDVGE
jgi:transcriptional regulator with XRE-family HTH domain